MGAQQRDEKMLAELNERSVQAENKASREELEPILADDITIIRSTGVIEDKQRMLERVASYKSGRIREIEEANVSVYGDSAVVTSRIALREPGGEISGRFWNTLVFVKREGGWRCVTWQVTRIQ